jgi:cobalamin synthase
VKEMKEKLNMYTVCMAGWMLGTVVTIYILYENVENKNFVNLTLAAIVFWMMMMLLIQDVAKPIAQRRFQKNLETKIWKNYLLCLIADLCIVAGFFGYLATAQYIFLGVIFVLILIRAMKRKMFFAETVNRS